ncbi:MAG: NUDIX hydrolase [bacterium]|nr:NUDIX hydrolase [bacterium]
MKKEKAFCCYCGQSISKVTQEDKERDYCPHCNTIFYENPLPVASSIVVNENREVLLVKRQKEPYKDMWCLPIGFAETGEAVSEAALRELKEEAGIDGEIIRLIDVDTVDNYFYGYLVIVAYEVRMTGGTVCPGDDAADAAYFPITKIPPLAWTSNEKAIDIYIDLYADIWKMLDSLNRIFPGDLLANDISSDAKDQEKLLSDAIIHIIERHINDISNQWSSDIEKGVPALASYIDLFTELNKNILRGIQFWLKKETPLGVEEFIETGKNLKKQNIPLPAILTATALSRKSIWTNVVGEQVLSSPLDISTTLNINNRIIFYYDKINYWLTTGYLS